MDIGELFKEFEDNDINPRYLYDIYSVVLGVRKFGLIHLPVTNYDYIRRVINKLGLHQIAIRYLTLFKDEGSREYLLKDSDSVDKATNFEIWFSLQNEPNTHVFDNPGKYLDYPKCCVDSYESSLGLSHSYNKYLFSDQTRFTSINRLSAIFNPGLLMPDFFPCSLSCMHAKDFVEKCNKIVLDHFPEKEINLVKKMMLAPIILWEGNLICIPDWEIKQKKLILKLNKSVRAQPLSKVCMVNEENKKYLDSNEPKLLKFDHLLDLEKISFFFNDNSEVILPVNYI